ncbi:molecular chaperone, partial [Klebsiella pneumoniae]|nr:molecular chaperone [Klebsiella pneumoniae]
WSDTFLGKVESHAQHGFYRTLAILTREALSALYEELTENTEEDENDD